MDKSFLIAIIVICLFFVVLVFVLYNKSCQRKENFVPPGYYVNYNFKQKDRYTNGLDATSDLINNSISLQDQISQGTYPNFATIYGVFNNYITVMKQYPNDRIASVDELVYDIMNYIVNNRYSLINKGNTDDWRLLERKLVNLNHQFNVMKEGSQLLNKNLYNRLIGEGIKDDSTTIKQYYEKELNKSQKDEYNLADSVMDNLKKVNISSHFDYSGLLAKDTSLTTKSEAEHIMAIHEKRYKKYYNSNGERILPTVDNLRITESDDGTIRHDPLGYRGDPRVYSNNIEAAKSSGFNPDVLESIYQPSLRVVQVS